MIRAISDADPEPMLNNRGGKSIKKELEKNSSLTNQNHSFDMCAENRVGIFSVVPMTKSPKTNYTHVAPSINRVRMPMEIHGKPEKSRQPSPKPSVDIWAIPKRSKHPKTHKLTNIQLP